MNTKQTDIIIKRMLAVGWDLLLREYTPDCCIAAAGVVIDTLRHFHMRARPLTVRVMLYNPAATKQIIEQGHYFETVEQCEAAGGYGIGIGSAVNDVPSNPVWPYHLVVIAEEGAKRTLLDLTLPQLNRPERQIMAAPLAVFVSGAFLRGRRAAQFIGDDQLCSYEAFPDVTSYTTSPNWPDHPARRRTVQRMISAIKQTA
jgi:hypothetical protein